MTLSEKSKVKELAIIHNLSVREVIQDIRGLTSMRPNGSVTCLTVEAAIKFLGWVYSQPQED